jgi:Tfp pilus assembly protein PilX
MSRSNVAAKSLRTRLASRLERGSALLVTMMVLLLVSSLAVTGLQRSAEESTSGARLRSTTQTLHAADSGVQLVMSRLTQSPPNLTAFDVSLAGGASVASRARTDLLPQDIGQAGLGTPAEGFALNLGAGVTQLTRIYTVRTTAVGNGSTVELEAKLARMSADAGGY